jgi:hypothetical protein
VLGRGWRKLYGNLELAADPQTADFVLPGPRRSHFGTRPQGFPSGDQHPFAGPYEGRAGLAMKIGLSHKNFWPFEPVELDVELSLSRGQSKPVAVPDEIDPGYPSFQIWITRPDGERFRYRPQTRFCYPNGERLIARAQPFRRDISIFRQAGAYTFTIPGRYQVQAALRLRTGQFLLSNARPCLRSWVRRLGRASALSCKRTKREGCCATSGVRRRTMATRRWRNLPDDKTTPAATGAAFHYALGKAFVRSAESEPVGVRALLAAVRYQARGL